MGIKTQLTLQEANHLFDDYRFESIEPTVNGIVDTTYIVHANGEKYILKKYEEALAEQIDDEALLLQRLTACKLNVPSRLVSGNGWHLYTLLKGEVLASVSNFHLQRVARTLSAMHHCTAKMKSSREAFHAQTVSLMLDQMKTGNFTLYKQLSSLRYFRPGRDGIIHADLFLDNVLFDNQRLGVIDFVDAGEGSFAFDLGVTALVWATRGTSVGYLQLFLKIYNQSAPRKIMFQELLASMQIAAQFYTLSRLHKKVGAPWYRTELLQKIKLLKRSGIC